MSLNADKAAKALRPFAGLAAVAALALLAGCAQLKRDSMTVGAVPDDYRTNHPIAIAEKEQILDIPVAVGEQGLAPALADSVAGFAERYAQVGSGAMRILLPSGSPNETAARHMSGDVRSVLVANGVPAGKVMVEHYPAGEGRSSPMRLSYIGMVATTGQCGRWPDDILNTSENKHYENFGCAVQNNLAAQIANPADLNGPRRQSGIDATQRSTVIERYQSGRLGVPGEVSY